MTHRRPLRLILTLVLLGLGAAPAIAALAPAQPTATYVVYLPAVVKTYHNYLPLALWIRELPINVIANGSFENEHWVDVPFGNQDPVGWTYQAYNTGQTMPFPTKQQAGSTVPAISGGYGEYVHKYYWQLPYDEWLGAIRGLIIDGNLTYKIFSDHLPHALRLSQTLAYTPGRWVTVTGYILGEAQVAQCSDSGVLEADHFIGSVQLGSVADTRFYNVMRTHHDVPGNVRAWNKFSVTTQVPPSGQLPLVVIAQSNWACPVDFFIDHFQAFDVPAP